jgi:hypothetical protein
VGRYCVVEFNGGSFRIDHRAEAYADAELFRAFEQREVPEREFIYGAFFGRRPG